MSTHRISALVVGGLCAGQRIVLPARWQDGVGWVPESTYWTVQELLPVPLRARPSDSLPSDLRIRTETLRGYCVLYRPNADDLWAYAPTDWDELRVRRAWAEMAGIEQ
jgi:hypothetical protein